MFRIIFLMIVIFLPTISYSVTSYQIEMIVFSNINDSALKSEQWDLITNIDIPQSYYLSSKKKHHITQLPSSKLLLTAVKNRITMLAKHKILLHAAWKESLAQLNTSHIIHLYGGNLYNNHGEIIKHITNESLPYSNNQRWQLDGYCTIKLNRYFKLNFNLTFLLPTHKTNDTIPDNNTFIYTNISEKRNTKSKELNYIDHPLYGVLFKITPYN